LISSGISIVDSLWQEMKILMGIGGQRF